MAYLRRDEGVNEWATEETFRTSSKGPTAA